MRQSTRPKVLMIDDEEEIVGFFGEVFAHYPAVEFLSAFGGREGLDKAKQEKPEVIVLDLKMPDVSGEKVLEELCRILPETQFLVVTGQCDETLRERIEQKNRLAGYYKKPVPFEEMVSRILKLLQVEKTEEKP